MELKEVLFSLYHNSFNVKLAVISAYCNGPIAAAVNHSHGSLEMLAAFGTQAAASFISTGITGRVVQHFSPIENRAFSYIGGTVVPALMTLGISLTGHLMNDTPETLESCVAPVLISATTAPITNYLTRRGHLRPENYPTSVPLVRSPPLG